ncbi:FAD:protein FMN transferase [Ferrimonas lipolytica]|uniref:FAD:protein FMN transferase n=1 Tax=Ferrimonas lipolytica TaxID=2724191 RepID=A0A6H1U986_9GAMM|nr:FAD:protein FMN transferase [Ferrimonas lipolytica]QIZ75607.1 FAD:protein FMN transferase [Ferrimonas lipolytica]
MTYQNVTKWLALIGLAIFVSGCTPSAQVVKIEGSTMGTSYHISWVGDAAQAQQLQTKIDDRLVAVNQSMSHWQPDSLISRFNHYDSTEPMTIDHDFATVMAESIWLAEQTERALDVTIAPIIDLWGFGPQGQVEQAPSPREIAMAQALSGINKVSLNDLALSKSEPLLTLNLSAIAKGFGVDVVADLLEQHQIGSYMVEIGGELRLRGTKPAGKPWRIAIERPDPAGRELFQVIEPGNMAVATSGDYRNFFEENGTRFSHLIDPRSGAPITNRLASVTVLSPSCMRADGFATAFSIMGTEASLAYANEHKMPVMLIEKSISGQFNTFYSDAFKTYVNDSETAQ